MHMPVPRTNLEAARPLVGPTTGWQPAKEATQPMCDVEDINEERAVQPLCSIYICIHWRRRHHCSDPSLADKPNALLCQNEICDWPFL